MTEQLRFDEDQPRDPDGKFASGGGSGAAKAELATYTGSNGEVQLDKVATDFFSNKIDLDSTADGLPLSRTSETKDVDLKTLYPTQGTVTAENVKWQIDHPKDWQPIEVVRGNDGKNYVINGNHRLVAALLLGHETIKATVTKELPPGKAHDKALKEMNEERFSEDQPRDPDGKFGSGSGSGMKKSSIPMTSDKEKTDVQKAKLEKARVEKLLKQYQLSWVKAGAKGSFHEYVKTVDVVNSKKIIDADESRAEVSHVHKYGNTQANIPVGSDAALALDAVRSSVLDDDLAGQGRDVEGNHVTVRYGLMTDDCSSVAAFLSRQSPFEAELGSTEMFPPTEHSDGAAVIKAPVTSIDLRRINAQLAEYGQFKPADFDYSPHATIAYVKLDAVGKYVDLEDTNGKRFNVDTITISKRDGTHVDVKLTGGATTIYGPQGEPIVTRFNEDQPRDKDGKFGSGGESEILYHGTTQSKAENIVKSGLKLNKMDGQLMAHVTTSLKEASAYAKLVGTEKDPAAVVALKPSASKFFDSGELGEGFGKSTARISEKTKIPTEHIDKILKGDELRFNPDQPRDPDGKFGSGAGDKDVSSQWTGTHAYHATSLAALKEIKESGKILPSEGMYGKGVYFAPTHDAAKTSSAKDADVVLRVKMEDLPKDFQSFPEQGWTSKSISTDKVAYSKDGGKTWYHFPAERAYRFNPDQPRDADGKFGSGGESSDKPVYSSKLGEFEKETYGGTRAMFEFSVGGEFVGSVEVIKLGATTVQTENLEITQSARGNGYAKAMYVELFNKLKEDGFKHVESSKLLKEGGDAVWMSLQRDYPDITFSHERYQLNLEKFEPKKSTRGFNPDQPRDKDGKFGSGADSTKGVAVSSSELTASKNVLVAAYNKEHSSDFYKKAESYSGHSTLKVPDGFKEENMVGFAQGVHQSDGSYVVGNVEVQSDNRRQGVATKLYDSIEKTVGQSLKPSPLVSADAQAFWKSRSKAERSVFLEIGPQGEPIEIRFSEDQPRDADGKFASGRDPVDVNTLPVVEKDDWGNGKVINFVATPFKMLDTKVESATVHDTKNAVEKEVSLASLHSTQTKVTVNGMLQPRDDSHGLPFVVHSNGVNYIQDGHHRLSKDYFDGKNSAKVRYVDLDAK